ncbi:MAG: lysophospholipid acyltransferase family protein [Oscillospiraceae bacterium]
MWLYKFGRAVVKVFYKVAFKIKIQGLENIPKNQNFIVCANHRSNLDPPFVAICLPCEIRYMAKEELFKNKLFAYILRGLGVFPIQRGKSDIGALRAALKFAKNGENVAMFPEGGRSKDGNLRRGKMGAAMIAIKSNVNILPVGIEGKYKFRAKMQLNIGEIIDMTQYSNQKLTSEDLQMITDTKIMTSIANLAKVKTYEDRNS